MSSPTGIWNVIYAEFLITSDVIPTEELMLSTTGSIGDRFTGLDPL